MTPCIAPADASTSHDASRLLAVLAGLKSVAVALSGGVDSAVVACAAQRALGSQALAFTGDSPSVARNDIDHACQIASLLGIRHELVPTQEFDFPAYVANDGARCYHCKSTLYDTAGQHMVRWGTSYILSGANLDDLGDYRPGLQAAAERQIRHPLVEAGLGKDRVRALARLWGLPIWDKPASPCLSSRLAPGVQATPERVARVESGELFLRDLGYPVCRVRVHAGELARVEIPAESIPAFIHNDHLTPVSVRLKELGFQFVTLDMEGFRTGNLNILVPLGIRTSYAKNRPVGMNDLSQPDPPQGVNS
ncbi:MAG: ATP-dependent sacrificial sulfur transferase LarE [Planctomycetota bacterium]|nr:MAG: ATP-dependent sacrificial sulfur transferase LarE [Planctomycetota bacterium]